MDQTASNDALNAIADEAFAALRETRQITPFSSRRGGLDVDNAYRVTPRVRQRYEALGWKPCGRKIGFTNRTIWQQYGVYAPIWGHVFDKSVQELATTPKLSLAPFSEPRIEPEIIFGLSAAPSAAMEEAALLACIEWVALGFEIVQSIYPGWKFTAADTIAANGVHGALVLGPRHPIAPHAGRWQDTLSGFEIELHCDGRLIDRGHAGNVLDGPLSALRHVVELLERDPVNPPLAAGEIVSTGTLTQAMPVSPGELWTATPAGIALQGVTIGFV